MPINATVTAKTGPDRQLTAAVFNGITGMLVLPDRKVLQLFTGGDTNSPPAKEIDLTGVANFVVVIAGNTWTVTVS
jgi:hypothetical protein